MYFSQYHDMHMGGQLALIRGGEGAGAYNWMYFFVVYK